MNNMKASDYLVMYIDYLNEDGYVTVYGIEFAPADILSEMDPIAFRCGFNDFLDYMGVDSDELDWNVNL